MIDEPPPAPAPPPETIEAVQPHLPTERQADGSIVIDLAPLASAPRECAEAVREPDPFNPEIVVCRETVLSPRLGPDYGPSADQLIEGTAVPRARWRLSDDAQVELNGAQSDVGGFASQGGEVRVKIDF